MSMGPWLQWQAELRESLGVMALPHVSFSVASSSLRQSYLPGAGAALFLFKGCPGVGHRSPTHLGRRLVPCILASWTEV